MNWTRKTKSLMFLPLATAAIGAPLALAISCGPSGGDGTFVATDPGIANELVESADQGAIVNAAQPSLLIAGRPTSSSSLESAWKVVADKYNSLPTTTSKFTFEFSDNVQIGNIRNSINESKKIADKFKYNLLYDYPDVITDAAVQKQVLPLASTTAEASRMRNIFSEQVVAINDNIVVLPKNSFYALPLAKSTEFMAVNKPLAAHLFKVAKSKNYISAQNTAQIDELIDEQEAIVDGEYAFLASGQSAWRPKVDAPLGTNQFDDSIFTDAKALLDFAKTVRGLFTIVPGKNASNADYSDLDYNILGIDSAANFVYSKAKSLAGQANDQFLFYKKNANDLEFTYDFLTSPTSTGRQNFDAIYNALSDGIASSAVYIKYTVTVGSSRNTQYSSNRLKRDHRMAFAIGSTAGYVHNSVAGGDLSRSNYFLTKDELGVKAAPGAWGAEKKPVSILQGPSLLALKSSANQEVQKFVKWLLDEKYSWEAFNAGNVSLPATKRDISAAERFSQMAGYTYTSKESLAEELDSSIYNDAQKAVHALIKEATNDSTKSSIFEDPVDYNSGEVRSKIEDSIAEQSKQYYTANGKTPWDAQRVITEIYKNTLQRG